MKKEILQCDIENREKVHDGEILTRRIQVVFDHDQEDGLSKTKPYLCWAEIEMCQHCYDEMVSMRTYISAYGAMGYNKYFFAE